MSSASSHQPCPRCQFPTAPGEVFCRQCGLRLTDHAAQPDTLPSFSQPLSGNAAQPSTPSEFFAGPETAASPLNWDISTPPAFNGIAPPPEMPTAPLAAMPIKPRRRRKIILLALAIMVALLGAGGSLAYIFTRTNPVIQVSSAYDQETTLIGSASTSFQITGQQFVANTSITFLLDGRPAPGDKTFQSDANGNIEINLPVTSPWGTGKHVLTARDMLGNTTKDGVSVEIVAQGADGTPGPNGSPSDNDSFTIDEHVTGMTASGQPISFSGTLSILNTGPGGSVCGVSYTGRPWVYTGTIQKWKVTYTETVIYACHVTYKQGHLHYVDTATSETFVLGDGRHCAAPGPYTSDAFDGAFSSSTSISGTFYRDYSEAICPNKTYIYFDGETGTWQGII